MVNSSGHGSKSRLIGEAANTLLPMRGRHATKGPSRFGRDLTMMVLGIVAVGALVWGALTAFAALTRSNPAPPATTVAHPATTAGSSTTSSTTTTTSTTLALTSSTTAVAVAPPSELSVKVLNAVGTNGLAARVSEQLAEAGYVVVEPDDYADLLDQSRVWYRSGLGPEAYELAAFVPDAIIELNPDTDPVADIVVVLGASYEE